MPEKFFTYLFAVIAIIVFQIFAKDLFPNGGLTRSLCAGLAGLLGVGLGSLIDKKRQ